MNLKYFGDKLSILQNCIELDDKQKQVVLDFFNEDIKYSIGDILNRLVTHSKKMDMDSFLAIMKSLTAGLEFTKAIKVSQKIKL